MGARRQASRRCGVARRWARGDVHRRGRLEGHVELALSPAVGRTTTTPAAVTPSIKGAHTAWPSSGSPPSNTKAGRPHTFSPSARLGSTDGDRPRRSGHARFLLVVVACDSRAQETHTSTAAAAGRVVCPHRPLRRRRPPCLHRPPRGPRRRSQRCTARSSTSSRRPMSTRRAGRTALGSHFRRDAGDHDVVQTGEVADSAVDITWFQVVDDGEHELFTHSVNVIDFQTASRSAPDPGLLAAGTYRVEAAVAGESLRTRFEVRGAATQPQGLLATSTRPRRG